MTNNPKHLSKSQEWGTPFIILGRSRMLLQGIDLDPASSHAFNQRVKAKRYYTKNIDALSLSRWSLPEQSRGISVFLNPPGGGGEGVRSYPKVFWEKLIEQWELGYVAHAVFIAFSIEALQVTQTSPRPMLDFPTCILRKRLNFVDENGVRPRDNKGRLIGNTHASAVIYVPPLDPWQMEANFYHFSHIQVRAFHKLFGDLGRVVIGA